MSTVTGPSPLLPPHVADAFAPTVTYLNTASSGLLPTTVAAAVGAAEAERVSGRFDIAAVDGVVADCRRSFARLTGFDDNQVAIGSQVSQLVSLVAAALPPGATVVVPDDEFTSVLWPFLVRRTDGLRVHTVPLARLADAIHPDVDLVAASVVQSADGAIADVDAITAAAEAADARVLFDVTQAAGWYPVHDTGADWVVSVGYKWLLGAKGTAFLAGTDDALATLQPTAAGWYAGYNPWETCYGGPLRLADDARRFDVSPVWPAWLGQKPALDLLLSIGIDAIHRHNVALADRLRAGLGLAPDGSAIVSVDIAPDAMDRLHAADIVGSMRAGRLRLACHLYNTPDDIDRTLEVLTSLPRPT